MEKKKILKIVESNIWLILILAFTFLVRLVLMFNPNEIWWDTAVFVGMGKAIFSFGASGLWEPIRPLIWPFILGIGWKLGFNVILFGKILNLLMGTASVFLLYKIAEKIFDSRTALLSSFIFSCSAIFLTLTFQPGTEIPSTFFLLLGIYLHIRKRHLLSGIFFAAAALTRFTFLVFLPMIGVYYLYLWYKKKLDLRQVAFFTAGGMILIIPYLLLNFIMYGSILFPFIEANSVIHKVLGCNYLYVEPWYSYLLLLLQDSVFYLFSFLGIFYAFSGKKQLKALLLAFLLVPFIYHQSMLCKVDRYVMIFLPFLAMFSGYGLSIAYSWLDRKFRIPKRIMLLFIMLFVAVCLSLMFFSYSGAYVQESRPQGFDGFDFKPGSTVLSPEPWPALHSDAKIGMMYYPIFDEDTASKYSSIIRDGHNIYVLIDDCSLGTYCHPMDNICIAEKAKIEEELKEYDVIYSLDKGNCRYVILYRE